METLALVLCASLIVLAFWRLGFASVPREGRGTRIIFQLNALGRTLVVAWLCVFGSIFYFKCFFTFSVLFGLGVCRIRYVYSKYTGNFKAHARRPRSADDSPSNSKMPEPNSQIKEDLAQKCADVSVETLSERRRSFFLKQRNLGRKTFRIDEEDDSPSPLRRSDRSGYLDMDHIHLNWREFVIAYHLIFPSAALLQVSGLAWMIFRKWLYRKGFISPISCNYEEQVGRLCLESMQAIRFLGFSPGGEDVAIFAWSNIETLDNTGDVKISKLLRVEIELKTKRMKCAFLDDRQLTAPEAFIIINFNTASHTHPQVHAMANWGANPESKDPFIRWMSIVTVMYNYFGFTSFTQVADFWRSLGFFHYDFSKTKECFLLGLAEGVAPHEAIRKLMPHSSLVRFICKLRGGFGKAFQDHKDIMMGIDLEPLFASTVLHSLDHEMFTFNIADVLWLDDSHADFGLMAEACQAIRVGFSPELPLLPFNRKFSSAKHLFYSEVYRHACAIDRWFADRMDTCIIR